MLKRRSMTIMARSVGEVEGEGVARRACEEVRPMIDEFCERNDLVTSGASCSEDTGSNEGSSYVDHFPVFDTKDRNCEVVEMAEMSLLSPSGRSRLVFSSTVLSAVDKIWTWLFVTTRISGWSWKTF